MVALIIGVNRLTIRLIFVIVVWLIFGLIFLRDSRYTYFYKYRIDQSELHLKLNEQLIKSEMYWKNLLKNGDLMKKSPSDICSVMISSYRGKHPTLHYSFSSLIHSMKDEGKVIGDLNIYNTADPFDLNEYANELFVKNLSFVKVIDSSLMKCEINLKKNRFVKLYDQWKWNESIDYYCSLSICLKSNSRNILILQDDLIFTRNFYQKLEYFLNETSNCLSVRLFQSDYWDGWQLEDTPILILLSILFSTILISFFLFRDNRKCSISRLNTFQTYERFWNISPCPLLILLTFWMIYSIFVGLILLSIGRQNCLIIFNRKDGIYPMKRFVSGALGQLYSRSTIIKLREYLQNRLNELFQLNQTKAIDDLLNEFFFKETSNLVQCEIIPDLIDHIGVYSSSTRKNQGDFISMKQSGTFRSNEAAIDFY